MRKSKKRNQHPGAGGFSHTSAQDDFYSGEPTERPLHAERPPKDPLNSRKTLRHQKASEREPLKVDPREKGALIGVIKASITLIFLVLLFFMLWKGIKLYEESIWIENQSAPAISPVLQEVVRIDDFDISDQVAEEAFSARIAMWDEIGRLVRSVDDLLLRNNVDEAIKRCQKALQLNPFHIGALELLGELYFRQEMYLEAVNTYIRLLSVDPSRTDFQLALLKSLDAYGDAESTINVARWYQGRNLYNAEVQRCLANAFFVLERHEEAVSAYERVLKDFPRDVIALEHQAVSYMQMEQYDKALATLERLVAIEFRDLVCHMRIAICHAQLGDAEKTVQILGKSAHIFGPDTVTMWIQDPLMDPVRMEREFQVYADTVITEEYRKYLESMSRAVDQRPAGDINLKLGMPQDDGIDADVLGTGKSGQ